MYLSKINCLLVGSQNLLSHHRHREMVDGRWRDDMMDDDAMMLWRWRNDMMTMDNGAIVLWQDGTITQWNDRMMVIKISPIVSLHALLSCNRHRIIACENFHNKSITPRRLLLRKTINFICCRGRLEIKCMYLFSWMLGNNLLRVEMLFEISLTNASSFLFQTTFLHLGGYSATIAITRALFHK